MSVFGRIPFRQHSIMLRLASPFVGGYLSGGRRRKSTKKRSTKRRKLSGGKLYPLAARPTFAKRSTTRKVIGGRKVYRGIVAHYPSRTGQGNSNPRIRQFREYMQANMRKQAARGPGSAEFNRQLFRSLAKAWTAHKRGSSKKGRASWSAVCHMHLFSQILINCTLLRPRERELPKSSSGIKSTSRDFRKVPKGQGNCMRKSSRSFR
jgi:hypothetical protein